MLYWNDQLFFDLAQEASFYEEISKHIGCHSDSKINLGMMGRPGDLLDSVHYPCKDKGPKCEEVGKRSCDMIPDCWGFAVYKGWSIQIYNSSASNPSLCTGRYGLKPNNNWKTFRKSKRNIDAVGLDIFTLLVSTILISNRINRFSSNF